MNRASTLYAFEAQATPILLQDVIEALRWVRPQRLSSISMTHPFIELNSFVQRIGAPSWRQLMRQTDSCGRSLLHHAAEFGVCPAMKPLLEACVDVNGKDNAGNTPLHWAAQSGHLAFVCELIEVGARPSPVNSAGLTPLQLTPARQYWAVARAIAACSMHADTFAPANARVNTKALGLN